MIKNIEIGEIVTINRREWLMVSMEWEQPTLVLLDKVLKGINKKPYYKKKGMVVEDVPTKKFKIKTLGNIKNA